LGIFCFSLDLEFLCINVKNFGKKKNSQKIVNFIGAVESQAEKSYQILSNFQEIRMGKGDFYSNFLFTISKSELTTANLQMNGNNSKRSRNFNE
jgi:hypothetical protein